MANNHAKTRYSQFESALNTARMALDELERYVKKFDDKTDKRFHGWQVPTKKEITSALRKADAELDTLKKTSSAFKAKLIANDWRV